MSKNTTETIKMSASRENSNKIKNKHRKTNSTSSNLSIIDLNDNNDKDDWNFFTSTQNLASVLNDPNVNRTVSDQIFTRDWGSYFNEGTVIKSSNLTSQQIQMRREYIDYFMQNLNNREKFKKNLNVSKDLFFNDKQQTNKVQSINLENLIPSIFLKENFKLENLDTFKEIVNEDTLLSNDISLKTNNETIKQTIKDLEKQLTDHLDVVEEHLAKQISVRFREFFHIMNAMELVMEQLNTTIREVTLVRKNCNRLQETLVYPSLKNIQLTKKKATLQSVYEKIRIMATVHETQPTIQNFLSTYDYVGALDLITATQEVYDQDLNGLTSFRHLNSQLTEIKKVIVEMMKEDFVKFLAHEWNRPFTKLELELKNFDRMESFNFDKEKLSCMIVGMLKVEYFEFIETFIEEARTTIQASIKQTVIECLSNEDRIIFKSNLPFEQLNELDFHNWLSVLNQIFDNLYIVLKRIHSIHIVIGKTINKFENSLLSIDQIDSDILNNGVQNNHVFKNNQQKIANNRSSNDQTDTKDSINPFQFDLDENDLNNSNNSGFSNGDVNARTVSNGPNGFNSNKSQLNIKLDKCLFEICQFCHIKCSEIINSKTKDNFFISKVSFDEFSNLVKMIEKFTACNESICSKNIPQLKLALRTQTNKYVTKFHDDHKKGILSLLDIEQWKPLEQISPEFQKMINDLIDYNYSFNELHRSRKQAIQGTVKKGQTNLKCLEVNGEKFVIVFTIISFVHIIIEYCSIAAEIKSIAPDLLTRLANLFEEFNSKVMKLVLLAEACQISGLKTITSRHLIVANRCLKLILILLPYVKNHFTNILSDKNRPMLKHFDKVKEIYVKHIQATIKKVIEVVNDVLVAKINKWEAKPPVPSTEFKEITIHLQRLYSNIQETLPEDELNQLLVQIYESFTKLLKEQMIKLKIVNDDGPQHL